MQSQKITRRNALTGAGAVAGASLIAVPALASGESDAELKALWREYLVAMGRWERANCLCERTKDRCVYEAEMPRHGKHAAENLTVSKNSPERFVGSFFYMEAGKEIHFGIPLEVNSLDEACAKVREMAEASHMENSRQMKNLRRKYGVAKLERTERKLRPPVTQLEDRIIAAKAHGIEGISIQLALSMHLDPSQTCEDMCGNDKGAAATAYRALCDLTGTDLAAEASRIENEAWA